MTNIKLLKSDSQYCLFNIDNFQLFDINQFLYDVISHLIENGNISRTANYFQIEESDIIAILDTIGYTESPTLSFDETKTFNDTIDRITLHVSNDCNLRCKYCYATGGTYGKSRNLMSIETAKKFVDYCCENFKKVRNIVFFGGEPFLNYPVIEYICNSFQERFNNGQIRTIPKFGAITNGTISSDKVLSIIEKFFSFITVSVDGPKEINDLNRVTDSGSGSFDRINKFLKQIITFPNLKVGIEATFTKQHIDSGYTRKLIQNYFQHEFNIKADVVDEMSLDNSNNAINGLEKPLDSPWFDSILRTIISKEHEKKCPILRSIFAVSSDGGIYPCHMNIGDGMKPILSIWESDKTLNSIIQTNKSYCLKNNEICQNCWAKNICGGCSRLSFYDSEKKAYSHTPIKTRCDEFKLIVEKTLLKICEVRTNPKLWEMLLTHVKNSNH